MPLHVVIVLCLAVGIAAPGPVRADRRRATTADRHSRLRAVQPARQTIARPPRRPNALRRAWRAVRRQPVQTARYGVMGVVNGIRGTARLGLKLGSVAGHVSGVGSLGLTAHAAWRLARARTGTERADACRDLGTGMSGLGCMGYWASPVSLKVGLVGVGVQSTVGAYSLIHGLRQRDRPRIVLGALDLSAGLLFGASLLSYLNPYTMVAAVALTAARVGYAKRHGIKSAVEKLRDHLMRRRTTHARAATP